MKKADVLAALNRAMTASDPELAAMIPQELPPEILADKLRYCEDRTEYFHMGRKIGEGPAIDLDRLRRAI